MLFLSENDERMDMDNGLRDGGRGMIARTTQMENKSSSDGVCSAPAFYPRL